MAKKIRKIRLSLKRDEALRATRICVGKLKLACVLISDKRIVYPNGKSRIAYIGTTKKGIERIAQSVAFRANDILKLHGVRTLPCKGCHVRAKTTCETLEQT